MDELIVWMEENDDFDADMTAKIKVAELGKLADTKQSLLNEFPFAYNFKISTDRVEVYQ